MLLHQQLPGVAGGQVGCRYLLLVPVLGGEGLYLGYLLHVLLALLLVGVA